MTPEQYYHELNKGNELIKHVTPTLDFYETYEGICTSLPKPAQLRFRKRAYSTDPPIIKAYFAAVDSLEARCLRLKHAE